MIGILWLGVCVVFGGAVGVESQFLGAVWLVHRYVVALA